MPDIQCTSNYTIRFSDLKKRIRQARQKASRTLSAALIKRYRTVFVPQPVAQIPRRYKRPIVRIVGIDRYRNDQDNVNSLVLCQP